MQDKNTRS